MKKGVSNLGMYDPYIIASGQAVEDRAYQEDRKLEERDRVIESQQTVIEEYEAQKDVLFKIEEATRAYFSDAWKDGIRAFRDQKRLPTHDINIFAPEVDGVVGLERQTRRDIRLVPVERDDEKNTDLFNIFLRHQEKTNKDFYKENDAYKIALIGGRAHEEMLWDFSDDPFGELKTRLVESPDVLIDHNMTDPDPVHGDKTIHIHMEWVPIREVTKRYKKGSFDWSLLSYGDPGDDERRRSVVIGGIDDRYDYPCERFKHLFWKPDRQWIRIFRIWKRDHKTVYRLLDMNPNIPNPDLAFVDDFETEAELQRYKIKMALSGRDTSAMEVTKAQVYYWSFHTISGRAELEWKPDIGRYCPWIDYFAITVNGKYAGLWNRVEDRQRQVNYIRSKASERVGRLGHIPLFFRQQSFAKNINLSEDLRDGNPIPVLPDVWDKLQGQAPIKPLEDESIKYLTPLLEWAAAEHQDAIQSVGQGSVQRGNNPPGVTAASALAILQQEGTKITSGYSQNLMLARAAKAALRLYMLFDQYKKTPELVKLKMERIFGSVLTDKGQADEQQVILSRMLDGGIDMDRLLLSIRSIKYDVELTDDPNSFLEKQQIIQWLQVLAQNGMQTTGESLVELAPIPGRIKDQLRKGVADRKAEMEQMIQTPEGQAMLQMQTGNKMQAQDGNAMNAAGLSQTFGNNSLVAAAQ